MFRLIKDEQAARASAQPQSSPHTLYRTRSSRVQLQQEPRRPSRGRFRRLENRDHARAGFPSSRSSLSEVRQDSVGDSRRAAQQLAADYRVHRRAPQLKAHEAAACRR